MKKKLTWIAYGSVVVALAAGCGHKYVSARADEGESLSAIKSVAVFPFENLTKFHEAGKIVPDIFATELYIYTGPNLDGDLVDAWRGIGGYGQIGQTSVGVSGSGPQWLTIEKQLEVPC